MMRRCLGACVLVAMPIWGAFATAPAADAATVVEPVTRQQPYEMVDPGAAYCAPRVLYFMARYSGVETTLDEVVALCHTNDGGDTTLLNLHQAAQQLGLHPRCVECTADELLACNGPAIVCIRALRTEEKADADAAENRVHFIGLVRREADRYRVIDPSTSLEPLWIPGEALAKRFSGYLVHFEGFQSSGEWSLTSVTVPTVVMTLALAVFVYLLPRRKSLAHAQEVQQ